MVEFVYLKAGAVLTSDRPNHTGSRSLLITADMAKLRYLQETDYEGRSIVRANGYNRWILNPAAIASKVKKFPSISKETRANFAKHSKWEFTQDWTFSGYHINETSEHTIPAGTVITMIDAKLRQQNIGDYLERCIVCELTPEISMFANTLSYRSTALDCSFIPAAEAFQYLKLVSAPVEKTYWRLEDSLGDKLSTKRYDSLKSIKAAIRVKGGFVDAEEWLDQSNEINLDNGLFAAEYNYLTDAQVQRLDMSKFFVMSALKA